MGILEFKSYNIVYIQKSSLADVYIRSNKSKNLVGEKFITSK